MDFKNDSRVTVHARKLSMVLLVFCILLPMPAAAAPVWQGEACLPGDPYDLDQMIQIMSRPNPPTGPVQINADLSLVYAGVGVMSNQWVWDWGMVVIPDYLGNQTGWMGYGAWSAGVLNNETHLNRGYPRCNVPNYTGEPAGCQQARLYGDTDACELGDYSDQLADGWNRRITVSCDLSKGHSGSPIYHYRFDPHLGATVPVVTMVVSTEVCDSNCSSTNDFPSAARRLTPADVDVISFFREAYP